MLHPRAIVLRGGQVLAEHPLPPGSELVLGRSEGCDVTIADGSVSRLHARLVADIEGVYVEDLGSANGTFVDGERTHGRVRLGHGQQVRAAQRAQSAPLVVRFEDVRPARVEEDVAAELEAWDADRTQGADADRDTGPPFAAVAASEPLWQAGTPQPVAATVPVAEAARPAPATPPLVTAGAAVPPSSSRKTWVWALAAVVLLGGLAVAAAAAWWLAARPEPKTAQPVPMATAPTRTLPAAQPASPTGPPQAKASSAAARREDVLVVPVESDTGAPSAGARAATSLTAVLEDPLSGKWTARLENVFYPEDDYVVELTLDLHQRGGEVTGRGQVQIENNAMTFGVPATDVSGTVRRGTPPSAVRLRLAFGRPIGELQLEGTLDGDALAGTFRSSNAKQPGAWHAVRAQQ